MLNIYSFALAKMDDVKPMKSTIPITIKINDPNELLSDFGWRTSEYFFHLVYPVYEVYQQNLKTYISPPATSISIE